MLAELVLSKMEEVKKKEAVEERILATLETEREEDEIMQAKRRMTLRI